MGVTQDEVVFAVKNFGLSYSWPEDVSRFAFSRTGQNRCGHSFYIAYRSIMFSYFFTWLFIYGFAFTNETQTENCPSDRSAWFFIYLTTWTFLLLSIYNLVSLIVTLIRCHRPIIPRLQSDQWQSNAQLQEKLVIFLHETVAVACAMVAINYWVLVWDRSSSPSASNIHVHGLNAVYFVVDVFISAHPWRLQHFWMSSFYLLVYIVFSLIYFFAGGLNPCGENFIYSVLDYDNPGTSVPLALALVFVGAPVTHCIFYGIYRLRLFCYGHQKTRQVADINENNKMDVFLSGQPREA